MKGKHGRIRKHANRRASERIGLPLLDHRRIALIKSVKDGTAQFIRRQSNRVTVWQHTFPDTDVPITFVYDKVRGDIVTIWRADETGEVAS